jgi:SET domain-containing protein
MNKSLYIMRVPSKGRGVFTDEFIEAGELVESCPVITIPARDLNSEIHTTLDDYYHDWNERTGSKALALGYGALYNHSWEPNMECIQKTKKRCVDFYALRDIESGEELVYDYNPDLEEMWFEVE